MGRVKTGVQISFGNALEAIKRGQLVARDGWNGKGMYLRLVVSEIPGNLPYIEMKTADNKRVPWLASQTDLLSNDWVIY